MVGPRPRPGLRRVRRARHRHPRVSKGRRVRRSGVAAVGGGAGRDGTKAGCDLSGRPSEVEAPIVRGGKAELLASGDDVAARAEQASRSTHGRSSGTESCRSGVPTISAFGIDSSGLLSGDVPAGPSGICFRDLPHAQSSAVRWGPGRRARSARYRSSNPRHMEPVGAAGARQPPSPSMSLAGPRPGRAGRGWAWSSIRRAQNSSPVRRAHFGDRGSGRGKALPRFALVSLRRACEETGDVESFNVAGGSAAATPLSKDTSPFSALDQLRVSRVGATRPTTERRSSGCAAPLDFAETRHAAKDRPRTNCPPCSPPRSIAPPGSPVVRGPSTVPSDSMVADHLNTISAAFLPPGSSGCPGWTNQIWETTSTPRSNLRHAVR